MLKFLPAGFVGLMVGGLIAANSSTILTHLNWGASYLVHDFYRRFVKTRRRRAALRAARAASRRSACSSARPATVYLLDTAKDAFDMILQVGAGTGLLYLVRWFWWRVNAWCEIVAMVELVRASRSRCWSWRRTASRFSTHAALLITVAITTVCWVADGVPRRRRPIATCSIAFYRKVRPAGPGLGADSRRAGAAAVGRRASATTSRWRSLGWVAGCTAIWSALFAVGNFLYGRIGTALLLTAIFVVSGLVLIHRHQSALDRRSRARGR